MGLKAKHYDFDRDVTAEHVMEFILASSKGSDELVGERMLEEAKAVGGEVMMTLSNGQSFMVAVRPVG